MNLRLNRLFILFVGLTLFSGCSWFKSRNVDTSKAEEAAAAAPAAPAEAAAEDLVVKIKTKEEFENYMKTEKNLVVDFFATWCPPCKKMLPINKTLAAKYKDTVRIIEVNIDKIKELTTEYGVMGVPTFIFFKDGEMVHRKVGGMGQAEYDGMITTHFEL